MTKALAKKSILSGKMETMFDDHENYKLAKTIKTPKKEKVKIMNQITGKTALIKLDRGGTNEKNILSVFKDKKATTEQKDSIIAQYLFGRGLESASFLAELFLSKGQHTKEIRVFKSQVRFDFEQVVNIIAQLFLDISTGLEKEMKDYPLFYAVERLGERFKQGSEMLIKGVQATTEKRMREKGFGIYIDSKGKIYSIFDKEADEAIKKDKNESTKNH
jgi:competence protein ComGF